MKTLKNKKCRSIVQDLIKGEKEAKKPKPNNDLDVVKNNTKGSVPAIEKLIPLLPDQSIKNVFKKANNMLKSLNEYVSKMHVKSFEARALQQQ